MKLRRTHDKFYEFEERHNKPKEMFKFITNKGFTTNELQKKLNACDFGCANGEFLYYLNKISEFNLTGVDILPELINKSKIFVPEAKYKLGSILDKRLFKSNQFDISFLTGVHSIFDDFEEVFDNLINWTNEGGKIIITGIFNPFPIDVFINYRESKNYNSEFMESGWNIFSIESITSFLNNKNKIKSFEFFKFNIELDLPEQKDKVRSWTFKDSNKNRIITNGLSILQNHFTLIINL
jgi:SAM-dependent methyltransferase